MSKARRGPPRRPGSGRPRRSSGGKRGPPPGRGRDRSPSAPVPPQVRERREAELKRFLSDLGTPEPEPFEADAFQLEAVEAIRTRDVIVTAPTGAGKTWIAEQAIQRCLEEGVRAWYTSPLKALSNSKYQEFGRRFGADKVGIVTGDRQENLSAPVLVATAEIYRNRLYDFLRGECEADHGLAVFDEAHYLADPDRGVTWEEALIFAPSSVRCLLLSATVSNAAEMAAWLEKVRGTKAVVISRSERPVPLQIGMVYARGERVGPFWTREGKRIHSDVRALDAEVGRRSGGGRGRPPVRAGELVALLKSQDLTPTLIFMGSRAACDGSVESFRFPDTPRVTPERSARIRKTLEALVEDVPALAGHRHFDHVIQAGVAAHHAGHHPAWKLALEQLMSEGLLDALFSTTTMAAGVDFPTRSACLTRSVTWDGRDERPFLAREAQQMTGRAGRRGKDKVGFALVVPGPAMDVYEMAHSLRAVPEPLESQFKPSYTMALNLLGPFRPKEVEDLLNRSFGQFQVASTVKSLRGNAAVIEERAMKPLGSAVCEHPLDTFREDARIRKRSAREASSEAETGEDTPVSPCPSCSHLDRCLRAVPKALGGREKADRMRQQAEELKGGLWRSFERYANVLERYDYLDADRRPTADGEWTALLRLDHPLVLAEAIRRGVVRADDSIVGLAAALGGNTRELVQDPKFTPELRHMLGALEAIVDDVQRTEHEIGVSTEPSVNSSAAFVMQWIAAGDGWPEVECDDGDLVRLAWRTVDVLRQIGNLADTHPEIAGTARRWMYRLREDPTLVFE